MAHKTRSAPHSARFLRCLWGRRICDRIRCRHCSRETTEPRGEAGRGWRQRSCVSGTIEAPPWLRPPTGPGVSVPRHRGEGVVLMRASLAGAVGVPGRERDRKRAELRLPARGSRSGRPAAAPRPSGADEDEFLRIRAGGVTSRGRLEASHRTGLRPQSRHPGPAGEGEEALGPEDLPVGAAARLSPSPTSKPSGVEGPSGAEGGR